MLEAGADDFVSVNVTPSELRARVRAHLRRVVQYAQSHQSVVRLGQIEIHRDRYEVRAADSQVCLAPKEFALLEYLAANAERVVRREELLEHVWHLPQGLKSRTLDVHMSRLREKIAQGGMPVEIATVAGVGYRLRFL
jgi:two-component system alkaline phosphatase synthesis response regulator PhoP